MIKNSIRQLLRTPVKTILFLILIMAAGAFLALGCSLYIINNRNIAYYQDSFITIGTVEQKATAIKEYSYWSPHEQEYKTIQHPAYGELIPVSVLDFSEANYTQRPEKRPHYGSYNPEYKNEYESIGINIVELIALEDGISNQPVSFKVSKILWGNMVVEGRTIEMGDEGVENPIPLYKGIKYLAAIGRGFEQKEETWADRFYPISVMPSYQYNSDGSRVFDDFGKDILYYEITEEDYYQSKIGKRFLELIKGLERVDYTIPVTGTNATILLMPFYNRDTYISQGRDITNEEYEAGEKVCLIGKKFAKQQNLSMGDSLRLQLYYADYRFAAGESFRMTGGHATYGVNVSGEAFPIFEDSQYTIVGIYDIAPGAPDNGYGIGKSNVVIPTNSIENSDQNNITAYGPMKGFTTSFQIPNGTIEEFMKNWGKQGYDQLEITFYDRGYSKLKAGMENMKSMSLMLAGVGFAMVLFVLLFFCHLFITRQKARTAIERSLGMSKKKCTASLLSGILVILALGSILGASTGGLLSHVMAQKNVNGSYYDTMYSSGMADMETSKNARDGSEDIPVVMAVSMLSMIWIILLGSGISLYRINRNLKYEPMELLSEQKG